MQATKAELYASMQAARGVVAMYRRFTAQALGKWEASGDNADRNQYLRMSAGLADAEYRAKQAMLLFVNAE